MSYLCRQITAHRRNEKVPDSKPNANDSRGDDPG
jgi:hypothetical protein